MSESLIVSLGIQDKGASKQISALNKELRYLDKEFKATNKTSKDYEKTSEGLRNKLTYLEKSYNANNAKLSAYKSKMQETKDAISKKQAELEKLTKAENVNEKSVEKVSNQLDRMKNTLRSTEHDITMTETKLSTLTNEIENTNGALKAKALIDYKAHMERLGESVESTGARIVKFGDGMSSVGGNLMTATAPLVAFAGYATNVSMSFESAMSNVQAISGATGVELETMTNKAKEMGKSTSKSAKDAADGMSYMALAGWDTQQILSGIEPVLRLAEAGNLDLGRASDLTTDSLSALGLGVNDLTRYLDIAAQAQRKSNTTADALMEAYIACGGSLKNLNVPLEESATYLGILANRGKKGAEAGNSLNSILINLSSGAGQAGEAMDELGLSAYDNEGNFKGMNVVLNELNQKLSKCTAEQRDSYLAMIGGKTQIDTLNALLAGTNEEYGSLSSSIKNSNGALNEMAETMQSNAKGNVTKLKSQLEGLGIQIGEKLLPHVNDLIGHISKLIDWFGNLDEDTQQAIVKFGLLTFATGGTLKAVGGLTKGIGNLVSSSGSLIKSLSKSIDSTKDLGKVSKLTSISGIGKLTSSLLTLNPVTLGVGAGLVTLGAGMVVAKKTSEHMKKTILDTTDEMSSLEKGINKLNGSYSKSKEELIKSGLVYKDFNDDISPEFRESVEKNRRSLQEFNLKLNEINIDDVITKDEVIDFKSRVNEMCSTTIDAVKSRQDESKSAMKEMFTLDDGIIDESEKIILEMIDKNAATQIRELNTLNGEILTIMGNANTEKRILNEQEIQDIQDKMIRIGEIQLTALGTNQQEQLFAKNEFSEQVKSIDLETASSLLKEKSKLRDEENVQIAAAYNTHIDMLEAQLELASETEKVALQKEIDESIKARDQKIENQNTLYDELYGIMVERNPQLLSEINRHNGDILTNDDKQAQQLLTGMIKRYEGINQITESGMYRMKNTVSGEWEDVAVKVNEKTGQIEAMYGTHTADIGAYTDQIGQDLKNVANEHANTRNAVEKAVSAGGSATVNSSNQMVDANGKVISSLQDVKVNADKTRDGIISLNGKPVNVKVNKDGTISNLDEIKRAIEKIPNSKTVTVDVKYPNGRVPTTGGGSHMVYSLAPPSDIPVTRNLSIPEMPTTYDNMIVSGGYYNANTPQSISLSSVESRPYNIGGTDRNTRVYTENNSRVEMLLESVIKILATQNTIIEKNKPVINMDGEVLAGKLDNINGRNLALYGRFNG